MQQSTHVDTKNIVYNIMEETQYENEAKKLFLISIIYSVIKINYYKDLLQNIIF